MGGSWKAFTEGRHTVATWFWRVNRKGLLCSTSREVARENFVSSYLGGLALCLEQEKLASGEPAQSCPSCSDTDNPEGYVSGHVGAS